MSLSPLRSYKNKIGSEAQKESKRETEREKERLS
jgi:hypothetical protein